MLSIERTCVKPALASSSKDLMVIACSTTTTTTTTTATTTATTQSLAACVCVYCVYLLTQLAGLTKCKFILAPQACMINRALSLSLSVLALVANNMYLCVLQPAQLLLQCETCAIRSNFVRSFARRRLHKCVRSLSLSLSLRLCMCVRERLCAIEIAQFPMKFSPSSARYRFASSVGASACLHNANSASQKRTRKGEKARVVDF